MPTREAEIQTAALADRVRGNILSPPGDPVVVGFFVEIIIASVIGWLVQRCLSRIWPADFRNPSRIARWRLDRAIRRGCDEAAGKPEARAVNMTSEAIYALVAPRVREGFLRTGRMLKDTEIESFRRAMETPL